MLDDDDSSFAFLFALFTNGWSAVVGIIIAIAIFWVVSANHDECAKKTCPAGQTPKLMNHACLCATEAK